MSQPAPHYTLPGRYRTGRRFLLLLILFEDSQVIAHSIASSWAAIQMAQFHGSWFRELGQPLIVLAGYPIMAPQAWVGWDALRQVPAFSGVFACLNLAYARGPEHVLCFASSRSGKGVGLIVPTLLSLKDSAVVTDLKGENWLLTAGYRKGADQDVMMFNPVAQPLTPGGKVAPEAGSVRYNPLAEIRSGTREEVRDVQNVANILMDCSSVEPTPRKRPLGVRGTIPALERRVRKRS